MAKRYCRECKFYLESVSWGGIEPTQHLCKVETYWEDTPLKREKHYAVCLIKNKDNNCSDFRVKLSKWLKRPMWNRNWGRCIKQGKLISIPNTEGGFCGLGMADFKEEFEKKVRNANKQNNLEGDQ